MILEEVLPSVYRDIIDEPYHAFASTSFNVLNQHKAEKVYFLVFKDSKYRLGLIAGQIQRNLSSPFSAPFGGPIPRYDNIKVLAIEEGIDLIVPWMKEKGLGKITFTVPPLIYHESYIAKLTNVLYRKKFDVESVDLNFHFDLSKFTKEYSAFIWRNAKKNLAIAMKGDLEFALATTEKEQESVYKVIQQNRASLGVSLRLSWEEIVATKKIILADFFLVTDKTRVAAGAIVFRVSKDIAQVIYWGDDSEFQHLKTMNFLSFKIFEFYKKVNFKAVDIGCATVDSVPNQGLLEFKESLGCDIQQKFTFAKQL